MKKGTKKRILTVLKNLDIQKKQENYLYSDADWPIVYFEEETAKNGSECFFLKFIGQNVYARYEQAKKQFESMRGIVLLNQHHSVFKVFGAGFCVMAAADYEDLKKQEDEEKRANEAWWERYHAADDETKRKMACGAIQ